MELLGPGFFLEDQCVVNKVLLLQGLSFDTVAQAEKDAAHAIVEEQAVVMLYLRINLVCTGQW